MLSQQHQDPEVQKVIDRLHPDEKIVLMCGTAPNIALHWTRTPPKGVDYISHKLSLLDAMADLHAMILSSLGHAYVRGHWACGRAAFAVMTSLPHTSGNLVVIDDSLDFHIAKFVSQP